MASPEDLEVEDILRNVCDLHRAIRSEKLQELHTDYRDDLVNLPHVRDHIKKLKFIIIRQQDKLKRIYANLMDYGIPKDSSSSSNASSYETESNDDIYGNDENECDLSGTSTPQHSRKMARNGFYYEPISGLYYHYQSGFYYDAEKEMYYDGDLGKYLEYNKETETYRYKGETEEIPSEPSKPQDSKNYFDGILEELRELGKDKQESQYSREMTTTHTKKPIDSQDDIPSEITNSPTKEFLRKRSMRSATGDNQEVDCLRLVVVESVVPMLGIGQTFVIGQDGGGIGRGNRNTIAIPEPAVSDSHLKITQQNGTYKVADGGSLNGSLLNGIRISDPMKVSSPVQIVHGDVLTVGSTKFQVHIHPSNEVCNGCNLGTADEETKETFRELKNLLDKISAKESSLLEQEFLSSKLDDKKKIIYHTAKMLFLQLQDTLKEF